MRGGGDEWEEFLVLLREEENEGKKLEKWLFKQNFQNCVERRLKFTEKNQV